MLHGAPVTSGVTEVSWTGGLLEDAHLEEFGMSVHVPDMPDEALVFPAIQECVEGETRWIEVATGDEEPEHPAPLLMLVGAEEEPPTPPSAAEATVTVSAGDDEHAHSDEELHEDEYGFSVATGAALVMGATGTILGLAALAAVRAR
jgi:hypothetical protein